MIYLRIKKNNDFTKLFQKGKKGFSSSLTVLYSPSKELRMGVCVGKKYGKAHQRNKIKRLLREAFRIHAGEIKGTYSFILLPKVKEEYSFREFEKCIVQILKREKLI